MTNQAFDPFDQLIFFPLANGTQLNATVHDIDVWHHWALTSAISFSAQFAACLISVLMLLALTPIAKRRTKTFILYNFSLILNMVRLMCRITYYTSNPLVEFYNYFTYNPNPIPGSANAAQIVEVIGFLLLLICVEIILLYQSWIFYDGIRKHYRWALIGSLGLIATAAIVVRVIFAGLNIRTILKDIPPPSLAWQKGTLAIIIVSIGLFSLASCGKLLMSWRSRRKMGLKWGPMQWLFWASFESLLIPREFARLPLPPLAPQC